MLNSLRLEPLEQDCEGFEGYVNETYVSVVAVVPRITFLGEWQPDRFSLVCRRDFRLSQSPQNLFQPRRDHISRVLIDICL